MSFKSLAIVYRANGSTVSVNTEEWIFDYDARTSVVAHRSVKPPSYRLSVQFWRVAPNRALAILRYTDTINGCSDARAFYGKFRS